MNAPLTAESLRAEVSAEIRADIAKRKAEYSLEERDLELSEARYGDDYECTMYPPANKHVLQCGCVAERPSRRDRFEWVRECDDHEVKP